MAKKTVDDVTLSVTVYTNQIRDHLLERVTETVEAKFSSEIATAVRDTVTELVTKIAGKDIQSAVREVLAEGWSKTDDYGVHLQKVSLKDRISHLLNGKDRYSNSARWLDELLKKETETYLKGEFKAEIDAAKAKMRAEIDAVTQAKLKEALRAALGLG